MKRTNPYGPSEESVTGRCDAARRVTSKGSVFRRRMVHVLFAVVALLPVPGVAGVLAVGAMDTKSDWSVFVVPRGTGNICVSLEVAGATNAAGASPCAIDVGFLGVLFGVGRSWPGQGVTAAKPGSSSFSDSLKGGVTPTSVFGTGAWDYGPIGLGLDGAGYTAITTIAPTPTKDSAHARAESSDPVLFDATTSGQLGVDAVLSSLSLAVKAPGDVAAFGGQYALDGTTLFQFHIAASFGFTGPDDLDVVFSSILGPSFDAAMRSTLVSALVLDLGLGTVGLSGPVSIFPRTVVEFGAGGHEIDARAVSATQAVPEPTTVALLCIGLMGVVAARARRVGSPAHRH